MIDLSRIRKVNPLFKFSGETWADLTIECKACHSKWHGNGATYETVTSCPICGRKHGSSFNECFIMLSFMHFLPDDALVYHRDHVTIGMELDVYIPSLHLAIEPGSWVYHKDKIEKDEKKRDLCSEKGIRLYTIYDLYDEQQPPFDKDCYVFAFDLAQESYLDSLIELTRMLLTENGIDVPDDFKWSHIIAATQSYDATWNTDIYQEELDRRAPGIEALGDYVNGKTPIEHVCHVCNQTWIAKPSNVLMSGCQYCSRKQRAERMTMTHAEFLAKIERQHPTLEVLGQYKNAKTHIEMKCTECGTEWAPTPASLQRGVGCPKCAAIRRGRNRTRTQEEFMNELRQVNPDVDVLEEYTNIDNTVKSYCKKHGVTWEPTAYALLTGRGCPECAKEKAVAKTRKPLDEFLTALKEEWPDYEYIDGYVNANTKVTVRCKTCGHEWQATPHNLLSHHGCPECGRKAGEAKRAERNAKQFAEKLEKAYPGTVLISEYRGSTALVTVRCPHGHERTAYAVSFTSGRAGCKICRKLGYQ